MLVFYLLLTAVFSQTTGHFHVHDTMHTVEDGYVGINILDIQPSDTLTPHSVPTEIALRFIYEGLNFDLYLRNKPLDFSGSFQWNFIGNGTVDQTPVDFVSVRFPLKTLDTFSAQISHEGHVYRFKPTFRAGLQHITEKVVGLKRENSYVKQIRRGRRNLDIIEFEDCWPGQSTRLKQIEMGYVVDPPFNARVANVYAAQLGSQQMTLAEAVELELLEISGDTNAIYTPQLNVIIKIAQIIDQEGLFEEQMTPAFQLGCGRQVSTYLETFAQWRETIKPQTYGLWKLLTDCYPPPGTIGIAYVAQLCSTYGVGVTTWTGDTTWQTDAHEIGHIFGAGHSFENGQGTTGGIMDYGDGFFNGVYQFNPLRYNDLCSEISTKMANPFVSNCWTDLSETQDTTYNWIPKTAEDTGGTVGACTPEKGNYRLQTTDYKCIRNGNPQDEVAETNCDLGNKPIHGNSHLIYACNDADGGFTVPINAQCGDGVLEHPEECEPSLTPNNCCTNQCEWDTSPNCAPKIPKVDAAYVDATGRLYLFQGDQVYRYAFIHAEEADEGFPRPITTLYPGLTSTSYTNNIDAAFMKPGETLLYLFQGLTYVVYDTQDNLVQTTSSVAQQVDNALVGDCGTIQAALGFKTEMWLFCESVYNVVPHGGTWTVRRPVSDLEFTWEANDPIKTYISAAVYDHTTGRTRFWNANQIIEWSGRTPIEGYPLTANGLGETAAFTSPVNCADNCAECNSPTVCTRCESGFQLARKRFCIDENVVSWLQFNALQNDNLDQDYIKGGQQKLNKLLDDGKLVAGLSSSSQSDDGLAMYFNGQERLNMKNINTKMDTFSISAYYKPDAAVEDDQRFITFNPGSNNEFYIAFTNKPRCQPPSGCSCVEAVHPSAGVIEAQCGYHFGTNGDTADYSPFCYAEGTCDELTPSSTIAGASYVECGDILCSDFATVLGGNQFEIEVRMSSGTIFSCFVNEPLESDKWNKLSFEFSPTELKTGVNGVYHIRGYNEIAGENVEDNFQIKSWHIGADNGGIVGVLDHFQLTLIGASAKSDDGIGGGAVAAIVIFILIALTCVGFCIMNREVIKGYYEDWNNTHGEPQKVRKMSYYHEEPAFTSDVKMIPQLEQESPFYSHKHTASTTRVKANSVITTTETELPCLPETPQWYFVDQTEEAIGPVGLKDVANYVQEVGWEIAYGAYIWHPDEVPEWQFLQDLPQVIKDIQSVMDM